MKKVYFTLTGTNHYYGTDFLKKGTMVQLEKEPDNEFDSEAIKVELEGLGKIGYVANSPFTVQGDSMSAGRIYDKLGNQATGIVIHVLPKGVLCRIAKKDLQKKK